MCQFYPLFFGNPFFFFQSCQAAGRLALYLFRDKPRLSTFTIETLGCLAFKLPETSDDPFPSRKVCSWTSTFKNMPDAKSWHAPNCFTQSQTFYDNLPGLPSSHLMCEMACILLLRTANELHPAGQASFCLQYAERMGRLPDHNIYIPEFKSSSTLM